MTVVYFVIYQMYLNSMLLLARYDQALLPPRHNHRCKEHDIIGVSLARAGSYMWAGRPPGAEPPKTTIQPSPSSPSSPCHRHSIVTMVALNILTGLSIALLSAQQALALGQKQCITFPQDGHHHHVTDLDQKVFGTSEIDSSSHDTLLIASTRSKFALPLLLDSKDDDAIHLAAASFAKDVEKVTGVRPHLYNNTLPKGTKRCIMVGTAASGLVGGMGLGHVEEMKGKWEVFDIRVVDKARNLEEALVISGSDRVRYLILERSGYVANTI